MVTSGTNIASRPFAWWIGVGVVVALGSGCVRDPVGGDCPDLAVGELVISEVYRGPHAWIEVYNPGDRPLDLSGLRVTLADLEGDDENTRAFIVRDAVDLDPGAYAVLGQGDPRFWTFIDYDFTDDQSDDLEAQGQIALRACAETIDAVLYRNAVGAGAIALDGADEPAADANDDTDKDWCLDATPLDTPLEEPSHGSPGEANPPCPA